MLQNFVQIGNSKGVILSKDLLKQLGLDKLKQIHVEPDARTGAIVLSKKPVVRQSTNPRLLAVLDKVNKEYGPALKKLANL